MENRDASCGKLATAEEATSEVADIIALALRARENLEAEIRNLNKLLEAKRTELQKLESVVNFKTIATNRRP